MIQVIKSSRAILILFILYVCIAIAVFALNAASKKKDSDGTDSSSKTQEKAKVSNAELNKFQDELSTLELGLTRYVADKEVEGKYLDDSCIKLSDISSCTRNDYTQGSAYYSNGEYTIWFTDGEHYVSEFNLGDKVAEDDISSGFLTEYYNSCGAE